MSDAILTARGVCKAFMSGDRRLEVLAGVDLDVAAGESVSIRGESGSGKSTLLQLLAGLDAPERAHELAARKRAANGSNIDTFRARRLQALT